MRRDQPTTPFDVDADEMTQQFWGASKGWVSHEQQQVRRRTEPPPRTDAPPPRDDTTGSLRVIREGFAAFRPQTSKHATGEVARQRRHGEPRRPAATATPTSRRSVEPHREATLGELAAGRLHVEGWLEDDFSDRERFAGDRADAAPTRAHDRHDVDPEDTDAEYTDAEYTDAGYDDPEYDVPLTPVQPLAERLGLGAVDPLLLRAGALVLALILLVPVMLSLRPDRDDSLPGDVVETPQQVEAGAAPTAGGAEQMTATTTSAAAATGATTETSATVQAAAPDTVAAPPAAAVAPTSTDDDPPTSAADADADSAAAVDVVAERVVPACPQTYTAAVGDSWYRIADEAGVTPGELLAENNATTATVILPGDDICLPAGAAMPTPPTTAAPTATEAPDTSEPAPTTTDAPATTAPATTVAPVANLSRSEVQELIRETWPEDEVETALEIARRESNFIATADNGWCCVGVFQIYWTAHRSWLDDFGITERSDLFDARKNIAAAYHMWQQSGWGPWGG